MGRGMERFGDPLPGADMDVLVVGAGVAGLTVAALLAEGGRRVHVLEAVHYPGGCASSFTKNNAVFDIGATTFSGTGPQQPLGALFSRIGEFDGLLAARPPMGVAIDGELLLRFSDREEWIREAGHFFSLDLRRFWGTVSTYSDAAYRMLARLPYLPPRSAGELLRSLPALNGDVLRATPALLRSVHDHMKRHRVDDARFRRFVDAQLLITSQGNSREVPFMAGALGLSYPDYPVYAVRGGMIRYARWLEQRIRHFGGGVSYLQRVRRVSRDGRRWQLDIGDGQKLHAETVVTTVPLFNLPAVTEGEVRQHFTRKAAALQRRNVIPWGALTVYATVEDTLPEGIPINLQVLLRQQLEHSGSDTLFLSFSHPEDHERAAEGLRTLTISTHIPLGKTPDRGQRAAYRSWKEAAADEMLLALRRDVPDLSHLHVVDRYVGTPATFQRYTGRENGTVGGIPLHRAVFPFHYPRPAAPFDGLYSIGDTFFPGQGLPGVTLGALATSRRILERS